MSITLNDGLVKAVSEISSTLQPSLNRIKSDIFLIRNNFFAMEKNMQDPSP